MMLNKTHTHKEPLGYRGTAKEVVSAGDGVPYANPFLPVIMTLQFLPEGLGLVTSPSIAVGIDKKGYLAPAGGEIKPIGIIGKCLRSTAPLWAEMWDGEEELTADNLPEFSSVPSLTNGVLTGMDDLHGLIPTVYQHGALFERGYAWKKEGTSKALFEFTVGSKLRPITSEEIETCITDDTLPPLFGEKKTSCPKTKAYYAGMLVNFDPAKDTDKIDMICARVGGFRNPAQYDNAVYNDGFIFDYDMQGPGTNGQSRNVWNSISTVYGNAEYVTKIVDFYVTM